MLCRRPSGPTVRTQLGSGVAFGRHWLGADDRRAFQNAGNDIAHAHRAGFDVGQRPDHIDGSVFLNGETGLKSGDLVRAKITDADDYDIWGERVV